MSARKIKRKVMQRRRVVAQWLPAGRWVKIRKAKLGHMRFLVHPDAPALRNVESFSFIVGGP